MARDFDVKMEIEKFNNRLKKMRKRASNTFPLTGKIAIFMFKDVMDHFNKEEGPTGKWPKLDKKTIARREKQSSRILQDTGLLRASILPRNNRTGARVWTSLKYAKTHNRGLGAIPQRKFMWLSDKAKKLIGKSVGKFYIAD